MHLTWLPKEPKLRWALLLLLGLAFLLFLIKLGIAVNDPYFGGDAGHRMNNADRPLARLGNRIWLPLLQAHIWVFYLLGLPAWAFNLIPCVYFLVAASFLALLAFRIIGRTNTGLLFSMVVVFCFMHRPLFGRGLSLSQEGISAAFLYLLLWGGALELKPRPWLLLVAAAAMLNREVFWIYLFALTLICWRRIAFDSRSRMAFLALWIVPLLWLLSMLVLLYLVDGKLPRFPVEWPLMINKEGGRSLFSSTTLSSVWQGMLNSRILFAAGGILVVWLLGKLVLRQESSQESPSRDFISVFPAFSLLSLAIAYALVLVFDPWEATFGNPRIMRLAAQHLPLWAIIMFARAERYPDKWRMAAVAILVAGLMLSANPRISDWFPEDHSEAVRVQDEIERIISRAADGRKATVCFVGVEYFMTLKRFVGPTLYARREFPQAKDIRDGCDVVIAGADASLDPGESFTRSEIAIDGARYAVYASPTRSSP